MWIGKISDEFRILKTWNKRANKHRQYRVGVVVSTSKGIGVIVYRNRNELIIAHKSDTWLHAERYRYDLDNDFEYIYIESSPDALSTESKMYKEAWKHIINGAMYLNNSYEIRRNKEVVREYERFIKADKTDRTVSWRGGSVTYRRYVGSGFDFEINVTRPFINDGDKVLYVLGKTDTYKWVNGDGWVYTKPFKREEVMYGLCENVKE